MSDIDTSPEAVELLAADIDAGWRVPEAAALLRALAAERDECRALVREFMRGRAESLAECDRLAAQARREGMLLALDDALATLARLGCAQAAHEELAPKAAAIRANAQEVGDADKAPRLTDSASTYWKKHTRKSREVKP